MPEKSKTIEVYLTQKPETPAGPEKASRDMDATNAEPEVAITVGWSAGTAIQCAVSIGNTRGKHSSAAVAAWNTSQTTKFTAPATEAIRIAKAPTR
jgi:hypothetical protein